MARHPHRATSSSPRPAEAAFREFWRVTGLLRRVAEPHFARFGISPAQWGVLRALSRRESAGDAPPRLTDLGSLLLVRPPTVTGVVGRLERMGLLARTTPGGDQRSRCVCLTDEGRRVVKQVLARHPRWIGQLMAGLTAPEQAEFLRLLRRMIAHVEPLAERMDGQGPAADRTRAGPGGVKKTGGGVDVTSA
jgi:DNA-binding MarR family transcriptional regulator